MKKLSPLKLIVNNKNIEERSLDDYFQLKDTSMLEEVFNKLKMHFNANLDNEIHPWEFEKNLDNQLKGGDRIYFLYLYYVKYLERYMNDVFDVFFNDSFDRDWDELLQHDEWTNKEAIRLIKYDILGFIKIDGSKNKKKV
tara:strand:- start:139 stop:558 length:420 start_codon:yes stop_codon:yes gene_type:complete